MGNVVASDDLINWSWILQAAAAEQASELQRINEYRLNQCDQKKIVKCLQKLPKMKDFDMFPKIT